MVYHSPLNQNFCSPFCNNKVGIGLLIWTISHVPWPENVHKTSQFGWAYPILSNKTSKVRARKYSSAFICVPTFAFRTYFTAVMVSYSVIPGENYDSPWRITHNSRIILLGFPLSPVKEHGISPQTKNTGRKEGSTSTIRRLIFIGPFVLLYPSQRSQARGQSVCFKMGWSSLAYLRRNRWVSRQ